MSLIISAGTLGSLAMPNFCPRCFWIRLRAEKLPFQIPMPGIFSSIDSYVKKVVRKYYDKEKKLPGWFPPVGEIASIAEVPSYGKYCCTEPQSGATLRGVPDEVLQLKDGRLSHGVTLDSLLIWSHFSAFQLRKYNPHFLASPKITQPRSS